MSEELNAEQSSAEQGSEQSFVNNEGAFSENWADRFDEGDRATLSRYKNVDDLAKSLVSTKKKFGKNPDTLIEVPSDTSSDETKAAWRKANNVPESVEEYAYEYSDELAAKLGPMDDKKMADIKEFAFKELELTPSKFQKMMDFYHTTTASDLDAFDVSNSEKIAEDAETSKAELKKEWLGDYDNRVLRANAVLRKYGGEDAVASFNAQNSPAMAKFLDNIAQTMSEDTLKGTQMSNQVTATGLKSQINDVRLEMDKIAKENPVNYKATAKYKELTTRKHDLYKKMPA